MDLWVLNLRELETAASTDPPTSPLSTGSVWTPPSCIAAKSVSGDGPRCALRGAPAQASPRRCAGSRAWRSLSTTRPCSPARRGLVEADDLDRVAGACFLDAFAVVVVERAHLAPGVTGDDRVADAQASALHEHRRYGAAADVQPATR